LNFSGPSSTFRLPSKCPTTNANNTSPVMAMMIFLPINERGRLTRRRMAAPEKGGLDGS